MHIFYTPDITGDDYTLSAEESKHCVRVLRMAEGESVVLVDGRGNRYDGEIDRAEAKGCRVRILRRTEHYGARPFRLHLAMLRRSRWSGWSGWWKSARRWVSTR